MAGLVVLDLNGGDTAFVLVDDELWAQIKSLDPSRRTVPTRASMAQRAEIIQWLACDDPEVQKPHADCPDRKGKILKRYYTQNHVIEEVSLTGITGIITFQV